ncbi:F-box/kelch-repeat protein SKIP25-like [Lycium barbarum]|uniref:F-box/kelch-repeat protein SKIP25-like n=1 Tax=Lycium barbarum TaxID=112863 RepID=UPI00293F56F3|nr:F-box/kelch-repeat protein SKIP25-like [Lycium barbarum]
MNNSAIITSTAAGAAVKCRKKLHQYNQYQSLIPGLPDDIAQICLSLVQEPLTLYSVCQSWRRLVYSPPFPPFLSIYSLLKPLQYNNISSVISHVRSGERRMYADLTLILKDGETSERPSAQVKNSVEFANFDPISAKWQLLPPPPLDPPLRLLLRHPSFISRHLPIQSVSVSGNLIILTATTDHMLRALSRPLVFNPLTHKWTYGPPLAIPRRWCAAGASQGVVYVASGIGSHYNLEVARTVEKWDLKSYNNCNQQQHQCNSRSDIKSNRNQQQQRNNPTCGVKNKGWKWEKLSGLKDGKFSREAIEAIGWREKLCMVNVKGDAAKEGIIYDIESDTWQEMPEGMLVGWRGPTAAMEEEIIYTVDESKGALRKYDQENDSWIEILENEMLKGAQHMAAAGGKVCVVNGGGDGIVVVNVLAEPPSLVVVETPVGFQVLDVHILPRMSQLDEC